MYSNKITTILWGFALAIGVSSVAVASDPGAVKGFYPPVGAQASVLPGKSGPPVVQPSGPTTLVSGDSGASVNAGALTPVDSGEWIKCIRTCAISAAQYVELESAYTPVQYAVCFLVDSIYANDCPFSGVIGTGQNNYYFSAPATQFVTGLSAGSHFVQTLVYMTGSGEIGDYSLRYDVLK